MDQKQIDRQSAEMPDLLYEMPVNADALYDMPVMPKPSDEDTELFRQRSAEWVKLDDQVRKLTCAIKERRTHQRVLAAKVQEFMIKFGYDNIKTSQGIITSNVRNVKQTLKVSDIRTKLEELFTALALSNANVSDSLDSVNPEQLQLQQPLDYQMIITKIFEADRPSVVKQSLTRRIPKVSMSIDI